MQGPSGLCEDHVCTVRPISELKGLQGRPNGRPKPPLGIEPEQVRHFCETYRTSGNDPDGADAFLCLVAAICFYEGMAEMCSGGADAATLKEEAAIIVPVAKMLEACEDGPG